MRSTYEFLYKAFDLFNYSLFNNELPECMITLQKKKETNNGHFVPIKTWFHEGNEEALAYEININPINMNRPLDEVLETLLHEMVHYYCTLNNIKDVKGNGVHTDLFCIQCESHGLNCEIGGKGYDLTSLKPEVLENNDDFIKSYEGKVYYMYVEKKPVKKNLFKYTCPMCGLKIYAKSDKNVVCGDCGCELEMEEVEDEGEDC